MAAFSAALFAGLFVAPAACKRPQAPRLYGEGRFQDITQIRVGMSANEVERIMGSNHKTVWEEGMQGVDMGIFVWQYPEGKVYFNSDGVYKAVPYK